MSWEHANCPNPECRDRMNLVDVHKDDTGRIIIGFRCPTDGTETTVPEPDDNYQSRMEAAAKEAEVR